MQFGRGPLSYVKLGSEGLVVWSVGVGIFVVIVEMIAINETGGCERAELFTHGLGEVV